MIVIGILFVVYAAASGAACAALLGGTPAFWPALIALSCLNGIAAPLVMRAAG